MLGSDRPLFSHPTASAPTSKLAQPGPQQLLLLRQFVARVGGLENARRALEMIALLKRAA